MALLETNADRRQWLAVVFNEVMTQQREAEQKSFLALSGFIALVGVLVGVIGEDLPSRGTSQLLVSFLMLAIGLMAFGVLRAFRSWKLHYLDVARKIREQLAPDSELDDCHPVWLRPERPAKRGWGSDRQLLTILLVVHAALLGYVLFQCWQFKSFTRLGWFWVLLITSGYGVIMLFIAKMSKVRS